MKLFPAVLLIIVSAACSSGKENSSNIVSFSTDDPKVLRAMKSAQDSLPFYIDYFRKYHGNSNYEFFLKTTLSENGTKEHMWFSAFELGDNQFRAVLDNVPESVNNYELGDTVSIPFNNIEDFIIIADTTLIGNYLDRELNN